MAGASATDALLTGRSIGIGVLCIVAANLLLVGLRQLVEVPFSGQIQSMLATGCGVIVWIAIVMRGKT